jgi:glycosyltransferase involved in cell wall biosynthesis
MCGTHNEPGHLKMHASEEEPKAPAMAQEETGRPVWSVMIPAYNPRADYLDQALRSVLAQDPGSDRMQIELVDDCSTKVDVASMVRSIAQDRIAFSANSRNLGLAGCWNACIGKAQGQWIHILHQDDYVLPGFYERIEAAASAHPDVCLIATRTFNVDRDGFIESVTPRVPGLEDGGNTVADFYYAVPISCPGVVVRRSFYAQHGGFRSDLTYTLDVEMWARVVSRCGGLVLPDVVAVSRQHPGNETFRLLHTTEGLKDLWRLSEVFARTFPEFDPRRARKAVCRQALDASERLSLAGDIDAARDQRRFWRQNASFGEKVRQCLRGVAQRIL